MSRFAMEAPPGCGEGSGEGPPPGGSPLDEARARQRHLPFAPHRSPTPPGSPEVPMHRSPPSSSRTSLPSPFTTPGCPDPSLAREVREILRRHPGAALPVEELLRRLRAEGWHPRDHEEEILRRIRRALPTLVPARRRWVGLDPRPWVLAPVPGTEGGHSREGNRSGAGSGGSAGAGPPGGAEVRGRRSGGRGSVGHPLLQRLRITLARVGGAVLPCSTREMARWERYMGEESEVHRALNRRLRARRRWRNAERHRTTTPPPCPLPRG